MPGAYLYGWDATDEEWVKLVCNDAGKLIIDPSEIFENDPTDDEHGKAPDSDWAHDHDADVSAHHVKFTSEEARAACKLDGTLYWSCAGVHFDAEHPDVADITKADVGTITANQDTVRFHANVNLPHGATVTSVEVLGNAAASAETYMLARTNLTTLAADALASANINTADVTISEAVIDNSVYAYHIYTSSLDTDDAIYGARITYTL